MLNKKNLPQRKIVKQTNDKDISIQICNKIKKAKNINTAKHEFCKVIANNQLNTYIISTYIKYADKAQRFDEVRLAFYKARKLEMANTYIFNSYITAAGNAGELDEVQLAFEEACESKIADIVTFNAYITATGNAEKFDKTQLAFEEACQSQTPDAITLSAYITAAIKNNRLLEANEVINDCQYQSLILPEVYRMYLTKGLAIKDPLSCIANNMITQSQKRKMHFSSLRNNEYFIDLIYQNNPFQASEYFKILTNLLKKHIITKESFCKKIFEKTNIKDHSVAPLSLAIYYDHHRLLKLCHETLTSLFKEKYLTPNTLYDYLIDKNHLNFSPLFQAIYLNKIDIIFVLLESITFLYTNNMINKAELAYVLLGDTPPQSTASILLPILQNEGILKAYIGLLESTPPSIKQLESILQEGSEKKGYIILYLLICPEEKIEEVIDTIKAGLTFQQCYDFLQELNQTILVPNLLITLGKEHSHHALEKEVVKYEKIMFANNNDNILFFSTALVPLDQKQSNDYERNTPSPR